MIRRAFIIAILLSIPFSAQAGNKVPQAPAGNAAMVRIKKSATVTGAHVRLGDVADITDTNQERHAQLRELDLSEFRDEPLTIRREFLEIRILLAGYDRGSVILQGAEQTLVMPAKSATLTDLGVEEMVRRALSEQFDLDREDLNVKLLSPFMGSWLPDPEKLEAPRMELMPAPQLPLGRTQLTIRILDGERVLASRQASFEVTRRQQVVVATTSLDRPQVVTAENIREEMRFVDTPLDRLSAAQVIGHKVVAQLRPEDVITLRHLGEPAVEESPILVQAREPVRLIARKGALKVTVPVAEALQAGKQGQLVRVRNLQSNQIVTGVVVARGEVEVPLQ